MFFQVLRRNNYDIKQFYSLLHEVEVIRYRLNRIEDKMCKMENFTFDISFNVKTINDKISNINDKIGNTDTKNQEIKNIKDDDNTSEKSTKYISNIY